MLQHHEHIHLFPKHHDGNIQYNLLFLSSKVALYRFLIPISFLKRVSSKCLQCFLHQNLEQPIPENQVLLKVNMGQKPIFSHLYISLQTNPLFQRVQRWYLKGKLGIKLVQFRSSIVNMACSVMQNSNFVFRISGISIFFKDNKDIKTFWHCILLMFLSLSFFPYYNSRFK